jgi:predicted ATPase/DNA-binding SARP family transcriptional activator
LRGGGHVERAWLAGLLWPDSLESKALASLRMCLKDLRRALGPEADRLYAPALHTLALDLTGAEIDVVAFDGAIVRGNRVSLERAVALYRGPLLAGCAEAWVLPEREARQQSYLGALETLAAHARECGDLRKAERYLRLAVATDPLQESVQRALMQVLAACGSHSAALLVYRDLRLLLHRELSAEPDPETAALFHQIRAEAHWKAAGGNRWTIPPRLRSSAGLNVPDTPHDNLPLPPSRLIGRETEVAALRELLTNARLVTLTGPGGSGKTRLAIQVAADLRDGFVDGVCFVSLAPIRDPSLVVSTVARSLAARGSAGQPSLEGLKEHLRDRQLLLLLDNFEQVVAAAPVVTELLESCPRLTVLATSRMRLNLRGEHRFPVRPLDAPRPEWLADEDAAGRRGNKAVALAQYPAAALFLERTLEIDPDFTLTEENAPAVAEICHRLDGLPLALELAAAQIRLLPPQALLERLAGQAGNPQSGWQPSPGSRLRVLTGGAQDLPARQQTLRDTIAWSYDLLAEREKTLFRRLAVFAGGWSIEAAEAVCAESVGGSLLTVDSRKAAPSSLSTADICGLLAALADRSLVIREVTGGEARYRLLETIQEFALERLAASGEGALPGATGPSPEEHTVRDRHARYFAALVDEARSRHPGAAWAGWLDRLERELDNLRAVLAWLGERGNSEAELRLARALWEFWGGWCRTAEGRDHLLRALGRPGAAAPTAARAWALVAAGSLSLLLGNGAAARALLEEAVAVSREAAEKPALAMALNNYGLLMRDEGDSGAARRLFEEALAVNREIGDRQRQAANLSNLAGTLMHQGDDARAKPFYEEADAIDREFGVSGDAFWGPGVVALKLGDEATARRILEEGLRRARADRDHLTIADILRHLAQLACRQGNYAAARVALEESLSLTQKRRSPRSVSYLLGAFAALAVAQGRPERAARLLGAADAMRVSMGTPLSPADRAEHEGHVAAARAQIDEAAFAAAWAEGSALTPEEAADEARRV